MAEEMLATDVKDTVETETSIAESSPAETNDEGVFMLGHDAEDKSRADDSAAQSKDTSKGSEENVLNQTAEPPRKNAETRKQQLNSEIRDKIAERDALRKEIEELSRKKFEVQPESDLPTIEGLMDQVNPDTGDYYTRTEAKLARIEAERALERSQRQADKYTEQVVESRMRLQDEASRALKDFPMFDAKSPEFNQELTEQADRIAADLIDRDEKTGQVIGTRGSIYAVYEAIASAAHQAEASGKIAGRRATMQMMNSADVVGLSGQNGGGGDDDDPFLKGFTSGN